MHILLNSENIGKHTAANVLNCMKLMMASGPGEFGWRLIICLYCYINMLQVFFETQHFVNLIVCVLAFPDCVPKYQPPVSLE